MGKRPITCCFWGRAGRWVSSRPNRRRTSLDIFWLRDDSLANLDNLPDLDILAEESIENIEAALAGFKDLQATLNGNE